MTLRIAIVGGGIGGMAAAAAAHRSGADVHVYEKAHEITEIGTGVTVQPNALRVLDRLGLGDAVHAVGAPLHDTWIRRGDGRVEAHEADTGLGCHRADLLDVLASGVPPERVHINHHCVGAEQDDGEVLVRFADGTTARADVLVAADGIHSVLASAVLGDDVVEPRFAGLVAFRGCMPIERVPDWPAATATTWVDGGRVVRIYPLRAGRLLNYVATLPAAEPAVPWAEPGDPDAMRAEFAGWDPVVRGVLDQVDAVFRWGLYDRAPLPRWSRGRITLLGDAAHAMLPSMGQGANQAIEDGMALATMLEGADAPSVPELLVRYQALRHDRTARFQRGSRRSAERVEDLDDPRLRDVPLTLNHAWTYDYDVEREAVRARA